MMKKIFTFFLMLIHFFSPLMAHCYEQNRVEEPNREYNEGAKKGSYGLFVNELKEKLQKTSDLKEATRLATLVRAYIHGQIIAFDHTKSLTKEDWKHVMQAHATTTAFFSLSPLGTGRYREDTLSYVLNDVKGAYAQQLTIVADAIQALLWNNNFSPDEIRQHCFLQLTSPYYATKCDMTLSLGRPNDSAANALIQSLLDDTYLKQLRESLYKEKNIFSIQLCNKQVDALEKVFNAIPNDSKAPAALGEDEKFIWSLHDGQCGWYAVLPPWLRYTDANNIKPFTKYINYVSLKCKHNQHTKNIMWRLQEELKVLGVQKEWQTVYSGSWLNLNYSGCVLMLADAIGTSLTFFADKIPHTRINNPLSEKEILICHHTEVYFDPIVTPPPLVPNEFCHTPALSRSKDRAVGFMQKCQILLSYMELYNQHNCLPKMARAIRSFLNICSKLSLPCLRCTMMHIEKT